MFDKLRNYSKIIIIIIAIAMVVTGALYGIGAFNNPNMDMMSPSNNIATVNGANVSQQEYYTILTNQSGLSNLTRAQEIPFKYDVLSSIINRKLILQQADELKIKSTVTDQDVDNYLNLLLENNNITEEELENNLRSNNSTLKEFKNEIKDVLGLNSRLEQVQELSYSDVTVTEEEIVNKYEEIEAQIIVKRFADDKESAKNDINEALNKIRNGVDFKEVAEEYTDFSQIDLVMFNRESSLLPADITEFAFSLEKDKLSEIIEDENSYYLIKVVDKILASGEDYEGEKEVIKENILTQKRNEAFSNWMLNVRAGSDIVINDPILKAYESLAEGNNTLAIAEFEKVIEVGLASPMTYIYMAEAYRADDQFNKAQETYEIAIEEYSYDWELYFNYGMLLSSIEEVDQEKVIEMLDNASQYADGDFMAHYQLFMAYSQLGNEEKAEIELKKINELQERMQEQQETLSQSIDNSSETNVNTEDNNEADNRK